MLNTLGSRCAHAHYTHRDFWLSRAKKNPESFENPRLLFHGPIPTTNPSLQHRTPCAYAGYSTAVPLNLLNARLRNTPVGLLNASEPFCSRCLWGSAVDWLHASFKSPPRVFNFKKTPEQFGVSPLIFCRRIKCLFFASGGAWDLAGLRTMLSVFV